MTIYRQLYSHVVCTCVCIRHTCINNCLLQVGELYWALKDAKREDLAEELLDKNQEFEDESNRKAEGRYHSFNASFCL